MREREERGKGGGGREGGCGRVRHEAKDGVNVEVCHLHSQPSPQLEVGSLEEVLLKDHRVVPITRNRNRQSREDRILNKAPCQLKA